MLGRDLLLRRGKLVLGRRPLARELLHAGVVLGLAVVDLLLRGGNLGSCVVELRLRVGELLVRVRAARVDLGLRVVDLLLRGLLEVLETRGGDLVLVTLDLLLDRVDGRVVLVGAAHVRSRRGDREVDLVVGQVGGEAVARDVDVLGDHARSERRGAERARVGVVGRGHGPHDREVLAREGLVEVTGAVEERERVAHAVVPHDLVSADHALARLLRPSSVHEDDAVEVVVIVRADHVGAVIGGVLRGVRVDRAHSHGELLSAQARHGVGRDGRHGRPHPVDRGEPVHVVVGEAERRDHAQVVEARPVVVPVAGGAHVRTGHLETRVEAAAERRDADDGEEASERAPDASGYRACIGRGHVATTRPSWRRAGSRSSPRSAPCPRERVSRDPLSA